MFRRKILIAGYDRKLVGLVRGEIGGSGDVVEAGDGFDVLDKARETRFDLIILELNLAKLDGAATCRQLKSELLTRNFPVIILLTEQELRRKYSQLPREADDYVVCPFRPGELPMRVEMLIDRSHQHFYASPLTGLPGNLAIEEEIRRRIRSGRPFAVLYLDIDNFKSFNDRYGFRSGDEVIRQTARIIGAAMKHGGGEDDFVGHVGGDDFVAITTPLHDDIVCYECITEFDRLIPLYYSEEDRKKGYIIVKNRAGTTDVFPLMTVSIAVVTNEYRELERPGQVAQLAAELKSYLKQQQGSKFLRDRRMDKAEGPDGRKPERTPEPAARAAAPAVRKTDRPLGQMLIAGGLITGDDLNRALELQTETGQRLGQALMEIRAVGVREIGEALSRQMALPYVPLDSFRPDDRLVKKFGENFIRRNQVFPLAMKKNVLSLGMVDPLDVNLTDKIGKMTGCRVERAVVLEKEFREMISRLLF